MNKYIFIVGIPRSGNHLLRTILCGNSQIEILPDEMHFLDSFYFKGFVKKTRSLSPFDTDEKVDQVIDMMKTAKVYGLFWKRHSLDYDLFREKFLTTDRSHRSLFKSLLDAYAEEMHVPITGESTPYNVFHIKTLLEWFPESKVIHIMRDPRAVLSSEINRVGDRHIKFKKGSFFYRNSLFGFVMANWFKAYYVNKKYSKEKYKKNYLMVKNKDFMLRQEEVVKEMCTFIGVDYEENMLLKGKVASSFADKNLNPLNAWKAKLPKFYQFSLNLVLGRKMRKLDV